MKCAPLWKTKGRVTGRRWDDDCQPVKICRMENNVVYLTEEPPGSGSFYLPLLEDGKNVEEFEIVGERQVVLNDMEDHTGGR